MNPVDVSATGQSRIKGLIAIRDSVRQLIEYQTEDFPEGYITAEQQNLNALYDAFTKKYGLINSRANASVFNADSSYCLLASLEILDDEGNFVRKADMFSKLLDSYMNICYDVSKVLIQGRSCMAYTDDKTIYQWASQFRKAIEDARDAGCFASDLVFWRFPNACCGDTAVMLAEHLRRKGVETIYVWGWRGDQSHAWLAVKDERVRQPQKRITALPNEMSALLSQYGGRKIGNTIENSNYEAADLENALIIDITADQFGEEPVYVQKAGRLHKLFEIEQANDFPRIGGDCRLGEIYNSVRKFL